MRELLLWTVPISMGNISLSGLAAIWCLTAGVGGTVSFGRGGLNSNPEKNDRMVLTDLIDTPLLRP